MPGTTAAAVATHILFARHGEVEAPFVGTFVGSSDVGLSDLGRHQGQAIAEFLDGVPLDAIISSPLRRACDTAAPLAKAAGLDVEVRPGLAEMRFGQWEGLAWPSIEARDPEFAATWQADPINNPCPGGESAGLFATRIAGALRDILDEFDGRHIATFTHAGTNRAMLSDITRMEYMQTFCFAQDYGCVNAGAWDGPGSGQLALLNFVPGPRSEANGDGGRRVEEKKQ